MIVDKAIYLGGSRRPCDDVGTDLRRLRDGGGDGFLWVGLKDPTPAEFQEMDHELLLHPLAVEDALSGNQRPKIDLYEGSILVSLRTMRYLEETSDVETGDLTLFVGDRFVLTVRSGEANALAGLRGALEQDPRRLARGPFAVLHAVLDHVVDTYVRIGDELATDLEDLEDKVFRGEGGELGAEIYRLKREVLEFKRATAPLVYPLKRLVTGEWRGQVPKRLRPFFADVLDHLLQVTEHVEGYDHLLSDMLSAHLSQVSVQQNEDMRKISAWVAIAAFPTVVAGIYGMNFDVMPGTSWHDGFFAVLAVVALSCVGLWWSFRRSGWL